MFTRDTPETEAIQLFTSRYGYEPEICIRVNNELWVGPIKQQQ